MLKNQIIGIETLSFDYLSLIIMVSMVSMVLILEFINIYFLKAH